MKKIIPANAILIPDQAKRVFKGQIYEVYQWPQKLYDGKTVTFEMLKRPDTVQAICIVDNKILVLNDEQPHRGAKLSFPGGRSDHETESIDNAVKREVREETGYHFAHWRLIKVRQPFTKIEWFIYTYLAWGVTAQHEPKLDGGEIISAKQLSLDQVKQLAEQKAGYIGEEADIFQGASTINDLLKLPQYEDKTVDRD